MYVSELFFYAWIFLALNYCVYVAMYRNFFGVYLRMKPSTLSAALSKFASGNEQNDDGVKRKKLQLYTHKILIQWPL